VGTTVESGKGASVTSGTLSARGMLTSFTYHALALVVVLLVPAQSLRARGPRPQRALDVVFYRPPQVAVPARVILPPAALGGTAARPLPGVARPAPRPPEAKLPGPEGPGNPEFAKGPDEGPPLAEAPPKPKVGNSGILAFRDQFASLSKDKPEPRLGADALYVNADEVGQTSARSMLTTTAPGGSGGINVASLSRKVGGGGGGGGGGVGGDGANGGGGIPGVGVGRATSPIAGIGGGERPLAHSGPGLSRTDEEIQIVFDRYKASFYRLYNRELRNDPTLRGQMVLRLTIEPDGSVSMCVLQSTDMNAPDLSAQVVSRVKTINFGAKDVQALTIVYPIDFLPAA
jgi:hypothetical protein